MSCNPVAALLLQRNENRMYTRENLQNAQYETARKYFPNSNLYAPALNARAASINGRLSSATSASQTWSQGARVSFSDASDAASYSAVQSLGSRSQDFPAAQPITGHMMPSPTSGDGPRNSASTQHRAYPINIAQQSTRNKRPMPGASAPRPVPCNASLTSMNLNISGGQTFERPLSSEPPKTEDHVSPTTELTPGMIIHPVWPQEAHPSKYAGTQQPSTRTRWTAPQQQSLVAPVVCAEGYSDGRGVLRYSNLNHDNASPFGGSSVTTTTTTMYSSPPNQTSPTAAPVTHTTQHFALSPLAGGRFHEARPGERANPKTGHYEGCRCCKCRGNCNSWVID